MLSPMLRQHIVVYEGRKRRTAETRYRCELLLWRSHPLENRSSPCHFETMHGRHIFFDSLQLDNVYKDGTNTRELWCSEECRRK